LHELGRGQHISVGKRTTDRTLPSTLTSIARTTPAAVEVGHASRMPRRFHFSVDAGAATHPDDHDGRSIARQSGGHGTAIHAATLVPEL
jgi:hypothetical protein